MINARQEWKVTGSFPMEYQVHTIWTDGRKQCHKLCLRYDVSTQKEERKLRLVRSFPMLDISGRWYPTCSFDRSIKADWFEGVHSMTAISAPVMCFYNAASQNRHTIALSEIKQELIMQYGIHEEDGTMMCQVEMTLPKGMFPESYELLIWESEKEEPYWCTLNEVRAWWEKELTIEPMSVPDVARMPMYSFWYSQHQNVTAESVEAESKRAASLGFSSVIVDDGWQTEDNQRGYAFCGDWEPSKVKFPDFPGHVKRVQEMGLKYIVWFSVPYIGKKSRIWESFQDKLLCYDGFQQAGVLDLRYPEVREYLKRIYKRAVNEWKIDGLKLDFIDEFYLRKESPFFEEGMDCADIQEALNRLLTETMTELTAIRPDCMIEFRQRYIGPQIRKYGNLLRVSDCPGAGISNRIGTVDLRLLSGETAVHSDMLMWHKEERAEEAALQIESSLFSTVQISVDLSTLTERMRKLLIYWITFMKEKAKLLQESQLQPAEPENLYPEVAADNEGERLLVHYSGKRAVDLRQMPKQMTYIHGTKAEEVIFRMPKGASLHYQMLDCVGDLQEKGVWKKEGFETLSVPTGGIVELWCDR